MQSKSRKNKAETGSTSKDTGKQSPSFAEVINAVNTIVDHAKRLRSALRDCSGTELQKLKAMERVLSLELAKIDARIDELEPDTWGL